MILSDNYTRWEKENEEVKKHLVTVEILKKTIIEAGINSHKGDNGNILVIGGSPLFHGAGKLAANACLETTLGFGSRLADMVFFCSTSENIALQKLKNETFIGITREQLENYLPKSGTVLIGPGLMREADVNRPETEKEGKKTQEMTEKVLMSGKKIVLDAGSLQTISADKLTGKEKVIITPHQTEMKNLFGINENLLIKQEAKYAEIVLVAEKIQGLARKYKITILLKGPIDLIVNSDNWYFSPGGSPGLTKGGTGDVLSGIVTAIYSRINNPLIAGAIGSFLIKRISEKMEEEWGQFYNASDLVKQIIKTLIIYKNN